MFKRTAFKGVLTALLLLSMSASAYALQPLTMSGIFWVSSTTPSDAQIAGPRTEVLTIMVAASTSRDAVLPAGSNMEVKLESPTGSFLPFADGTQTVEFTSGGMCDGSDGSLEYIDPYTVVAQIQNTCELRIPRGYVREYHLYLPTDQILNITAGDDQLIAGIKRNNNWATGKLLTY